MSNQKPENTSPTKAIPFDADRLPGYEISWEISQDCAEAYLTIEQYPRPNSPGEDLQRILAFALETFPETVVDAFFENSLPLLLKNRVPFFREVVARGVPVTPGEPCRIEYHISPPSTGVHVRPDGSCDFKVRDLFKSAAGGEVILTKHPAVPGNAGRTVFGDLLLPPSFPDIKLRALDRVRLEDRPDGTQVLVACESGQVAFREMGKTLEVRIDPVLTISGNVDLTTGNVQFKGAVRILGSVSSGFSVTATGNIEIFKMVEARAKVVAGGDIFVSEGILGAGSGEDSGGEVKAGGTIRALYAENARIHAEGDIFLRSALNSQISAGRGMFVERSVAGGELVAFERIVLGEAGNSMGLATVIRSGISPTLFQRVNLLVKVLADLKGKLEKIRLDLQFVTKKGGALSPEKRHLLESTLVKQANDLQEQITRVEIKKAETAVEFLEQNFATVSARQFYPGVTVFLRASRYQLESPLPMTTIFQKFPEEVIAFRPYQPKS